MVFAWKQRKLDELMDFSNGINAPKESYGRGRKMISVMDILDEAPISYKNIRNSVYVSKKVEDKSKVENGDLVFVRSSEVPEEVGWSKAYLEVEYALYSGFSIRGKKKSEFDARFIELNLNSSNRKQIERKAGGSTRFNISQSILREVIIQEPSLEEQTKIGDFFNHLNNTIALNQQKLLKLEEMKRAYLEQIFNQRMYFSGYSEGWEQRELKSFSKETYGGGTPKTSIAEYWSGSIPWIQSSDLKNDKLFSVKATKFITEISISNSATKLIPKDSIAIVTRVGVGKLAYMPYSYTTSQDFLSLSDLTVDSCFGMYSIYYLLKKEINNIQGTSIKGITKNDLLDKKINIPNDIVKQRKIGTLFKQLDDTIALHEDKLIKLNELKKAFLQKLFV